MCVWGGGGGISMKNIIADGTGATPNYLGVSEVSYKVI